MYVFPTTDKTTEIYISPHNRQRPLQKNIINQKVETGLQSQEIHIENLPLPKAQVM